MLTPSTIHQCRPDAVAMASLLRSCEGKQKLQLLEMLQDEAPDSPGMGKGAGVGKVLVLKLSSG